MKSGMPSAFRAGMTTEVRWNSGIMETEKPTNSQAGFVFEDELTAISVTPLSAK